MFEKRLTRILPACAACLVIALLVSAARGAAEEASGVDLSTRKDALRAVDLGLQWLRTRQSADGSWSLKQYPAITALATRALLQDPARDKSGAMDPIASHGLDYIFSCAREDGGIYCEVPKERGGSLQNYNTAASLQTLGAARQTQYAPLIAAARRFLVSLQHLDKDAFYGGWGYDRDRDNPHADMTNTGFAIEALRATSAAASSSKADGSAPKTAQGPAPSPSAAPAARTAGVDSADPDWAAAAAFLSHCQNLASAVEKDRPVSRRPQDAGGFFYHPKGSMAGGGPDELGRQTWYSYGNATALGLACLLECSISRRDPRVTGAVEWLRSNFNLEEHPGGMGKQGLYIYYHSLATALSLYGEEPLKRTDGKPPIAWRRDLMIKLISLQRTDEKTGYAYWVNDEGRWMENDPVLVTAYCTLALETLLNEPLSGRP